MKITAYEVRPDEKDYLLAAAQQEQIEITLVQGPALRFLEIQRWTPH